LYLFFREYWKFESALQFILTKEPKDKLIATIRKNKNQLQQKKHKPFGGAGAGRMHGLVFGKAGANWIFFCAGACFSGSGGGCRDADV
jgi:hypothetical protein